MNNDYKNVVCVEPWRSLHVNQNGHVYFCCQHGWRRKLGSIKRKSIVEIWNSKKTERLRKEIIKNGHKGVCKDDCPFLYYYFRDKKIEIISNKKIKHLSIVPGLNCNLKCIMCVQNHSNKRKIPKTFYENIINYTSDLEEITLAGGEIFSIKESKNFFLDFDFKKYPNMKFNLITNGILLTEGIIERMVLHCGWINISVDASNEETYGYIRRGSSWKQLMKNLALMSEYKIKYGDANPDLQVALSFVVMKRNFREMVSFVELCERFDFTSKFALMHGNKLRNENLLKTKNATDMNSLYSIIIKLKDRDNKHPILNIKNIENKLKNVLKNENISYYNNKE